MSRTVLLPVALLVACNGRTSDVDVPEPTGDPAPAWSCSSAGDTSAPPTSGFDVGGAPEHVQILDLGVQTTSCGYGAPVPFEVPPDTTAITVVAYGHVGTVTLAGAITDPDGVDVAGFDAERPADPFFGPLWDSMDRANPVFPRAHRLSALVPNNDGVALPAGTWSFTPASWSQRIVGNQLVAEGLDSAVHTYVVLQREPEGEGVLDLALHFSGAGGITAASAPAHPDVQAALATFAEAYAPVGIGLGRVTYHDLPVGHDGTLFLDLPTCTTSAELDALLDAPVEPQPGALNVYFIERFACENAGINLFDALAGLSAGLPGTPFSGRDGVMVSTYWLEQAPTLWAKVLAHEAGHYLGLFHTAELTGTDFDPLADTPELPDDNLMFFDVAYDPDGIGLTAEQGRVVRRHPLIVPVGD